MRYKEAWRLAHLPHRVKPSSLRLLIRALYHHGHAQLRSVGPVGPIAISGLEWGGWVGGGLVTVSGSTIMNDQQRMPGLLSARGLIRPSEKPLLMAELLGLLVTIFHTL